MQVKAITIENGLISASVKTLSFVIPVALALDVEVEMQRH